MKIFIFKFLSIFLASIPLFLTSCGENNNVTFILSEPANKGDVYQFIYDVQNTAKKIKENNQKYNSIKDFNIDVKITNNDFIKKTYLENGTGDFAFLKSKTIMDNKLYKYTNPKIQTLAIPFVFDKDNNSRYINGLENDPLRIIASDMQNISFGKKNFKDWTDNEFQWNGIRYDKFYDLNANLINTYRGMILISGDNNQLKGVKDAWNKKDWNTFRNYGIITGESNSIGNFILQEKLLLKHFGNQFNTLIEDKSQNQNKYKVDSYGVEDVGKFSNFVISFSEEGSFSWTHNSQYSSSFRPINNNKIEILTVTNPGIYDIGVFNKSLDYKIVDLLTESIYQIYKQNVNNNEYPSSLGYNGFSKIIDFKKEVIEPYNLTFK